MSTTQQTTAIAAFISEFAGALSTRQSKSISDFYTPDGIFFPDHYKTINRDQLQNAKGEFFSSRKFAITFEIAELTVKDNFAFVQAVGKATVIQLPDGTPVTTTTRDFFVLVKEGASWKIFRYMFNKPNK